MFGKSKAVGEHLVQVASAIEDRDEFSRRAQRSAQALGTHALRASRAYFWQPPEKPAELRGRFERLGEWMSVCQAAIFEIWFHLGEAALEDLRSVAFGDYDWTQAYATDALCRLALAGHDTDRTAEQLAKALSGWREEQVFRVCGRVAELAARSEPLQRAYDQLTDAYLDGDPVDGFELLAAAAPFGPGRVKARYGDLLRRMAEGAGLEGRTTFDDGQVVSSDDGKVLIAKGGPTYPQVKDFHRIRAAVLLHELDPADPEATQRLQRWAAEHPDPDVRKELAQLLAARGGTA